MCSKTNSNVCLLFKNKLQGFVFYHECSDKTILNDIKWDYIIYVDIQVNSALNTKHYALLIPDLETPCFNRILDLYEPSACANNRHNIEMLRTKIVYYNTFFKQKQVSLTKYERKWAVGIPENKMDLFYSFPETLFLIGLLTIPNSKKNMRVKKIINVPYV